MGRQDAAHRRLLASLASEFGSYAKGSALRLIKLKGVGLSNKITQLAEAKGARVKI